MALSHPIAKSSVVLLSILVGSSQYSATALVTDQRSTVVCESDSDEVVLLVGRQQLITGATLRENLGSSRTYHHAFNDAAQATQRNATIWKTKYSYDSKVLFEYGTRDFAISIFAWAVVMLCCFFPIIFPIYLAHVKDASMDVPIGTIDDTSFEENRITNGLRSYRWFFLFVFSVAYSLDSASQVALVASFGQLKVDVGLSPDKQGALLMLQKGANAVSSILWATVADRVGGHLFVLGFGCGIASLATFATGFLASYGWTCLAPVQFAYGFGAGAIRPITQGILSDLFEHHHHGKVNAYLQAAFFGGSVVSLPMTAYLSDLTLDILVGSFPGWKLSFFSVGSLAVFYSLFIWMLAVFFSYSRQSKRGQGLDNSISHAFFAIRLPSSCLLVFVCAATIALVNTHLLLVEWAEYFCRSDLQAGIDVSLSSMATVIGTIVGGFLADLCYVAYPYSGRISLGIVGTILTGISWVGLMRSPEAGPLTTMFYFVSLGFTKMWAYVGTGRPLMMKLVSPSVIASFIAFSEMCELLCAAFFGPFAVGILATHVFGYTSKTSGLSDMLEYQKHENFLAFGGALTVVNIGFLGASLCSLVALYKTYPTDVESSKESASP